MNRLAYLLCAWTLSACTFSPARAPASMFPLPTAEEEAGSAPDYSRAVGQALKVVAANPLRVVPLDFDSPVANQVFDEAHPLVLAPGDAFVLTAVQGNALKIEFGYDEIHSGTIDLSAFPPGSLQAVARSDDPRDASLADEEKDGTPLEDASYHSRSHGHGHGSNCALTPHRPGCCLAAVKYLLRDMRLVAASLSNFPGVYGKFATQNLPSNFRSVGCQARHHPRRAMVCSYNSGFNAAAGHVEAFDGTGWYFGLGHKTLQNDGYHTCIDCKIPR